MKKQWLFGLLTASAMISAGLVACGSGDIAKPGEYDEAFLADVGAESGPINKIIGDAEKDYAACLSSGACEARPVEPKEESSSSTEVPAESSSSNGGTTPGGTTTNPGTTPGGTTTNPGTTPGGTTTNPGTTPGGTTTDPGTTPGGTTTDPGTTPGGTTTDPGTTPGGTTTDPGTTPGGTTTDPGTTPGNDPESSSSTPVENPPESSSSTPTPSGDANVLTLPFQNEVLEPGTYTATFSGSTLQVGGNSGDCTANINGKDYSIGWSSQIQGVSGNLTIIVDKACVNGISGW